MGTKEKKTLKHPVRVAVCAVLAAIFIVLPVVCEIAYNAGLIPNSPITAILNTFDADAADDATEFVEFFNVGQGDCTIIKSGDMAAVVDFGVTDECDLLYKRLLELGITKLDLAVITHHHSDHLGGYIDLAEDMQIDRLLVSPTSGEDAQRDMYEKVLNTAKEQNTVIYTPKVGGKFQIGKSVLEVLFVDESAEKENNRSIITMLSMGGKRILLTGDAESATESKLVDKCNVDCDILKLGHHGSYTSTGYKLLKEATPRIAVASCGYDNFYSHPSEWTVERLKNMGVNLYRTDLDRSVRCMFENNGFYVLTENKDGI